MYIYVCMSVYMYVYNNYIDLTYLICILLTVITEIHDRRRATEVRDEISRNRERLNATIVVAKFYYGLSTTSL